MQSRQRSRILSFLFIRKKKQNLPLELCSPPIRYQNAKVPKYFLPRCLDTKWTKIKAVSSLGKNLAQNPKTSETHPLTLRSAGSDRSEVFYGFCLIFPLVFLAETRSH